MTNEERLARLEAAQWREHYVALYRSHATQNDQLIAKYGLEGEADARDIIERQEAALMNMTARNINLRRQLDDYDQLNAAFENVRMERDELQERNENLLLRNRNLEEDVRQLEEQMDGVDAGYDFQRQDEDL